MWIKDIPKIVYVTTHTFGMKVTITDFTFEHIRKNNLINYYLADEAETKDLKCHLYNLCLTLIHCYANLKRVELKAVCYDMN